MFDDSEYHSTTIQLDLRIALYGERSLKQQIVLESLGPLQLLTSQVSVLVYYVLIISNWGMGIDIGPIQGILSLSFILYLNYFILILEKNNMIVSLHTTSNIYLEIFLDCHILQEIKC